jgi:hypothetical protein
VQMMGSLQRTGMHRSQLRLGLNQNVANFFMQFVIDVTMYHTNVDVGFHKSSFTTYPCTHTHSPYPWVHDETCDHL